MNKARDNFVKVILLIFWPFLALVAAIFSKNFVLLKQSLFALFVTYGFTFVLQNEGIDSYRYYQWFKDWAELGINDLYLVLKDIFKGESYQSGRTDPFTPVLNFILSRFSIWSGLLFGVYAILMSLIMFRSLSIINADNRKVVHFKEIYYSVAFVFVISIVNINGFRFWFASWLFVFGLFQVFLDKNKYTRGLLIMSSSILVHFSFLFIMLLQPIIFNLKRFYFICFLIGLLGVVFPLDSLLLSSVGRAETGISLLDTKSENYFSDYTVASFDEKQIKIVWFKRIPFLYYGSIFLLSFMVYKLKSKKLNDIITARLIKYCCVFFMFISNLSELGELIRLRPIWITILIGTFILLIKDLRDWNFRGIDYVFIPFFLIHLSLVFRIGSETLSVYILGPVPIIFSLIDSFALSDLLF